MERVTRGLIMWLVRRATPKRSMPRTMPLTPWSSEIRPMRRLARRYMPLFRDEVQRGDGTIHNALPWWAPCNVLLHHWLHHDDGNELHDHPRWSISICLKGRLVEKTPHGERVLRPWRPVFRSARAIHGFRVERQDSARTWTLFIVGRRRKAQHTYVITPQTKAAVR